MFDHAPQAQSTFTPRPVRPHGPPQAARPARRPHPLLELQARIGNHAVTRLKRLGERRCACGGLVGPSGECESCRARRLAGAAVTGASASSSPVAASTSPVAESAPGDRDEHTNPRFLYQNGTTTCDFPAGTASSNINNPDCSRPCTVRHENKHFADITPCCMRAGAAHRAAATPVAKAAVETGFFNWMGANRDWFECRAYAISVQCADAEIAAKKCNSPLRAPGDAACCAHLATYRPFSQGRRVHYCGLAAGALTPCPY